MPPSYNVAFGSIVALLVRDLDGDGISDILGQNSTGYCVLFGKGDGSFTPGPFFSGIVQGPSLLGPAVLADFNGDGILDIAAASIPMGIFVLLGKGDGTFGSALVTRTDQVTLSLAVDDFNGDGKPDIVTAEIGNAGNKVANILLGNGDGTFLEAYQSSGVITNPSGFAIADFNGDGRPDVVMAEGGYPAFYTFLGAPVAGLTLAKTHAGNFQLGQAGATYTLTVKNQGPQTVSGQISVYDYLPLGITPTAMSGAGWACSIFSCGRSDSLPPSASFPPITITVSIATWTASSVVNTAAVYIGPPNLPEDWASDLVSLLPGQTITFAPLPNRPLAQPLQFQIQATAISGLPVPFSASGSCPVSGTTVTMTNTGQCSITASQAGNGTFPAAQNVVRSFTVFANPSSVSLGVASNPSTLGAPVTLTATVTPSNATGKVVFYDATVAIGSKVVSGGSALLAARLGITGQRTLRALYSGDSNYPPSSSSNVSETVNSVPGAGLVPARVPLFPSAGGYRM